jgi:hypothetical protein
VRPQARVVVVAADDDFTADLVVRRLDRDAFVRLDPGRQREGVTATGRFTAGTWSTVIDDGHRAATVGPGCAVYWRKPTRPETHTDPDERRRAHENTTALPGCSAPIRCCWSTTRPWSTRPSTSPPSSPSAARAGLSVPDTLFTCDPEVARAFIAAHHDKVVVKALTQRHTTFVPTTRIRLSDDLSGITGTVHYLQALVEDRLFDARVTVVADRVFTAAIRTNGALDWRTLPPAACDHRPVEAPMRVAKACVEHVRDLGLVYAALDFVVTADGWTYLETNCAGEFGWIEALTDLPVSAAIARVLTGDAPDARHTAHGRARM